MQIGKPLLVVSFIVFFIFIACSFFFNSSWGKEEKTCSVTDKVAYFNQNLDQLSYTIYTSCGTFSLRNDPFAGFYSSADVYGKLIVGKSYKLVVGGYAAPQVGRFKNIIEAYEME